MQRNMDLIREILINLEVEEKELTNDLGLKEYKTTDPTVVHHLRIMQEAGLIDVCLDNVNNYKITTPKNARLTWHGHDFLSKIKNETVWQKTKAKFKDSLSAMPFSLLNDVALELCKKAIDTA